jgi:cysteine desulfurase/selenocysteine lyase
VLPIATRDALKAVIDAHAARGVLGIYNNELDLTVYRRKVGEFIGGSGEEVALLRNTGDGATILAQGLDLEPGDEVIIGRNEFGSNAYPWLALQKRGVTIKFIDAPRERMTPATLAAAMTSRTRAVAVSWVTFDDGYRHDLAGLAEVAHRGNAYFFVDAIQGLGAFPLNAPECGVDALYAGGAKWLMSLQGVSFLYIAADVSERIALNMPSWRSVEDMWNFLDYDQPWSQAVSRYEGGTPNVLGALSLATSIGVLQTAGIPAIADHVLALTDQLADGLRRKGYTLRSIRTPNERSGIVTFYKKDTDPMELGKRIAAAGFVTTNRPNGIRVAPHGHNTPDQISAFLDVI